MVGWHHQLDGHEFEQAPGVGDGQGCRLAAVHRVAESDQTEQLNCNYSCLGNPMHKGVRWATVHVVAKSRT